MWTQEIGKPWESDSSSESDKDIDSNACLVEEEEKIVCCPSSKKTIESVP